MSLYPWSIPKKAFQILPPPKTAFSPSEMSHRLGSKKGWRSVMWHHSWFSQPLLLILVITLCFQRGIRDVSDCNKSIANKWKFWWWFGNCWQQQSFWSFAFAAILLIILHCCKWFYVIFVNNYYYIWQCNRADIFGGKNARFEGKNKRFCKIFKSLNYE